MKYNHQIKITEKNSTFGKKLKISMLFLFMEHYFSFEWSEFL